MNAIIDQDACIACGLCMGICPEVFSPCANGTVHAISGKVPAQAEDAVREAAENCPTDAIHTEE